MNFGSKELVGKDIELDKEPHRNSSRLDIDVWLQRSRLSCKVWGLIVQGEGRNSLCTDIALSIQVFLMGLVV